MRRGCCSRSRRRSDHGSDSAFDLASISALMRLPRCSAAAAAAADCPTRESSELGEPVTSAAMCPRLSRDGSTSCALRASMRASAGRARVVEASGSELPPSASRRLRRVADTLLRFLCAMRCSRPTKLLAAEVQLPPISSDTRGALERAADGVRPQRRGEEARGGRVHAAKRVDRGGYDAGCSRSLRRRCLSSNLRRPVSCCLCSSLDFGLGGSRAWSPRTSLAMPTKSCARLTRSATV